MLGPGARIPSRLATSWVRLAVAISLLATLAAPATALGGGPNLSASPNSGPPGLAIALSATGLNPGTSYDMCLMPADQIQCGYFGLVYGSVAAAADGTLPAGTSIKIPDFVAGNYIAALLVPGVGSVVVSTPVTITAPSISVTPGSGPAGTTVSLSGTGFAPGATYQVCYAAADATNCGAGVPLGTFVADGSGAVPSTFSGRVPGSAAGPYRVGVYLDGSPWNTIIAGAAFSEVAPMLSLSPDAVRPGGLVAVSGDGYAAGATYTICFLPPGTEACGYVGVDLGTFVADSTGAVPDGISVMVADTATEGDYDIGVFLTDSNPILLATAPVTVSNSAATPGASAASTEPSPSASPGPSGAGGGDGAGFPWWILLVLLAIGGAAAFYAVSRRKPGPTEPPTARSRLIGRSQLVATVPR